MNAHSPIIAADRPHRATKATTPDRSAFEAAVAALNHLKKEDALASAARHAARQAVYDAAPIPDVLTLADGTTLENEWQIDSSRTTPELRPAMKEALLAWRPQWDEAAARLGFEEIDDDELDTEADVIGDAVEAVLTCAAPDLTALVQQIRIAINDGAKLIFSGEHADDEETISRMLSSHTTDRVDALVYRSALRLAGEDSPALRATAFSASDWIETVEATTGVPLASKALANNTQWKALARWRREEVEKLVDDSEKADDPAEVRENDKFDAGGWIDALTSAGVSDVTSHEAFEALEPRRQISVRCYLFGSFISEEQDRLRALEAARTAQPVLLAAE